MKYTIVQKVVLFGTNSLGITIPAGMVAGMDIKQGDWLDVSFEKAKLENDPDTKTS